MVDLRGGDTVHWLRMEGVVTEIYDVITLPGVRRPMALGFRSDEINPVISVARRKFIHRQCHKPFIPVD